MRFKRLELSGFKSFVDHTVVEFSDKLTAVVGPNGCGKSNIADAIRWVLGEQSPRSIRARRMEDVIFNGSAERKSLGMSEVSLTVTDLKGTVTSPQYKDYDELVVTRRLYRSGESEYLINRNICRLKDITDLFLDTGVSLDSFSIVEQGRIESLVNAKPMDRRVLIEEAAGIMKFKARRTEALRKLELAQANLFRVGDILREKETRLRSLRRQARKATFFKEYQKEIASLELKILSLDFLLLETELEPVEKEFESLKDQEQNFLAVISSRESEREQRRIEVAEQSDLLAEIRRRAVEVEGILQRLENRVEMLIGQLRELDSEDVRRHEEMETLAKEKIRLTEEDQTLAASEFSFDGKVKLTQQHFDLQAAESSAVGGKLAELEEAVIKARGQLAVELEVLSQVRQRIAFVESQREGIIRSLDRIDRDIAEAEQIRREASEEEAGIRNNFEKILTEENQAKNEAKRLETEKTEMEKLLRSAEAEHTAQRESILELRSSLEANEKLDAFAQKERVSVDRFRVCGAEVLGAITDFVTVEPRFERAVEAALGERLFSVVVPNSQVALEAIRAIVASGAGRGMALIRDTRSAVAPTVPRHDGILGAAIDFVRTTPEFRPLMESLLGGIGIATDLDAAASAWRGDKSSAITWVTLAGEVILPSGGIEGGISSEPRMGVLEHVRFCEELRNEIAKADENLREQKRRQEFLQVEYLRKEKAAASAAEKSRNAELARVEAEGNLHSVQETLGRATERCRVLNLERAQVAEERETLIRDYHKTKEEGERSEMALSRAEEIVSATEKARQIIGADLDETKAALTDQRVALTEDQGRLLGIRAERQRLADSIAQIEARVNRLLEDDEGAAQKRKRIGMDLVQSREEIGRRKEEKSDIELEQAKQSSFLEKVRAMDDELGESLRELRAEIGALQTSLSEVAEKRTTLKVKREGLVESGQDTYGVDLVKEGEKERDQLPIYQEHVNRLEMLRQRLSRIGEVNPLAAREYDEVNEEYSFLREQQEDLERSIADLHATIDRLNKTTRSRFLEAFEQVSGQFSRTFSRLFQGGEARMYLQNPNDPLETGVDIEVRPPGKKPGNIMLLSAGEKALTAIALLFSVFSVRPSPFCLLDEVDATLDDANVGRFRDILNEMEDRTQFVIVTHNKKTMTYASQLYGITQREKGVSIVVSVKLNRMGENSKEEIGANVGLEADGRETFE